MLGRIVYGALFTLLLPALLVLWAMGTRTSVALPVPPWPLAGASIAAVGLALMLIGMWALWSRGGGLPMNAFPPPRLVTTGVFRLMPHPIYTGCCLACVGASAAAESASGLWLVCPAVILGCVALVYGYERDALRKRLGNPPVRTLLGIPAPDPAAPDMWDRASVYLLVLLPWLVLYEGIGHLPPMGAIDSRMAFERSWPVWTWTTPMYTLAYPFVFLVPFVAPSKSALRRFCIVGLIGTAVGMLAYIVAPVISPYRPFDQNGPFAWLLRLERADGLAGRGALPAFHAFWAAAAGQAWAARGRLWAIAGWSLAAAIIASCVTTGMHSLADLAGGLLLFAVAARAASIWAAAVRAAERVANSWREWRIGPVRIINHGLYAGAAAFVGAAAVGALSGPDHCAGIAIIAVCALIGASLWGQLLVGSPTLLRPFGYFGALLGAASGLAAAMLLGHPFWILAAALAAAAPWVVMIGRLRCLVQGCCHGRPVGTPSLREGAGGGPVLDLHPGQSIRYHHPRSRVCRIAHLCDVPVHPTPLYSMASNLVVGLLLARLWMVHAPLSLIVGVYLLAAGLCRFVEEHYRGEPQTQIVAGLHIYQWFAVASVIAGATITCIPTAPAPGTFETNPFTLLTALAVGAAFAFAMGVDFPESNRRFARLA